MGQEGRDRKRHSHAQPDQQHQARHGSQRLQPGRHRPRKKHGHEGNQRREPAVAGDEIIRQNGYEPFPGGIDNPASGDARGIAAEPHAHGQRLLAAAAAFLEHLVHVERHAGQITGILQQREQGEKDGHGRQHDGYDPRHHAVNAQHQHAVQPFRSMRQAEQVRQRLLAFSKQVGQPLGRIIRPHDGDPENQHHQGEHQGISRPPPHQHLVDAPVAPQPPSVRQSDHSPAQAFRLFHEHRRHAVAKRTA